MSASDWQDCCTTEEDDAAEATGTQNAHAWLCSTSKWPDFVLHWDRLQKLDLTAVDIGAGSQRLSLAALGHIPIVRLKSERGLVLRVPKQASWKHLWLECRLTMDLEFEEINTFGKVCSLLCLSARRTALSAQARFLGDPFCNMTCLQAAPPAKTHEHLCGQCGSLAVSCSAFVLPSDRIITWQSAG